MLFKTGILDRYQVEISIYKITIMIISEKLARFLSLLFPFDIENLIKYPKVFDLVGFSSVKVRSIDQNNPLKNQCNAVHSNFGQHISLCVTVTRTLVS